MSTVKNQHFVPQFYLRFFSPNETSISVYDKTVKKKFISAIDAIGCDKYFYDNENLDSFFGYQFIEKTFSAYESEIAPVLKEVVTKLEGEKYNISAGQRTDIAEFVWFQIIRTKENRIAQNQVFDLLKSEMIKRGATDEFLQTYGLIGEFNQKDEHLKKILDTSQTEKIINEISERLWVFVRNESKHEFITSDNPVVKHTHRDRSHHAFELFIPFTPKLGLMILIRSEFQDLLPFENRTAFIIKESEGVRFYNQLQIVQSTRQVFSKSGDFRLAIKMLNENPILGDLNRQRFEV